MTKKEKFKKFMKENGKDIVIGCVLGITAAICGDRIYRKGYRDGFIDGGMGGFHLTLDWLDKTFPDQSNAKQLWEGYKTSNPEQIVHWKGNGKWS